MRITCGAFRDRFANIKEAIQLDLETLPDERDLRLSREILTTTVEVNA
jgi:predicted RNase H-like HicB family nuclease